jgi:hypothetical protein
MKNGVEINNELIKLSFWNSLTEEAKYQIRIIIMSDIKNKKKLLYD